MLKTLSVPLPGREYDILIDRGILARSGPLCRSVLPKTHKIALVTDSNVGPLYAKTVLQSLEGAGFQTRLFSVPAGEPSKCTDQLSRLWEGFMEFGLTRSDAVAALGGGVVGDLAGFAAATILRGVHFVQIPTTLLAQVDSSVGGKVAIDLDAGKNLAGAFWQPRLVIMDPDVLQTLNDRFFSDGMAEVIKYGCIQDPAFFQFLSEHPSRGAVMEEIEQVLYTCCQIKRDVVLQDERDTGIRMILNFGHTMGHAFELAGNYETWSHGQAVAAGMVLAVKLGCALGVTEAGGLEELSPLLESFQLPVRISCGWDTIVHAVGLDKKSDGQEITMIFLEKLGKAVPVKMEKNQVLQHLERVYQP